MNTHPVISFVIGSYNRKPFLRSTLECIRNNGVTVPYEIIVVDGGSEDGSVHFLTTQRDVISIIQYNRGSFRGKKIERKSWGYFMNIGFRAAHGKYILMLSDDTLLIPGSVMNGYNFFEKKLASGEKIGALAFYFRNYPGDKQYFIAKTVGGIIYVNHGLYLVEALKKIDYLDENNYFFYHGDSDVCLRLKEAGYETIASPDSFVEHFKHASGSNRASHAELHAKGWENFKKRWGHLAPDLANLTEKNVNTKEYVDFTDTTGTARYFRRTYAYWKYRAYLIALRIKRKLIHSR